jgi:hypothetical protein
MNQAVPDNRERPAGDPVKLAGQLYYFLIPSISRADGCSPPLQEDLKTIEVGS